MPARIVSTIAIVSMPLAIFCARGNGRLGRFLLADVNPIIVGVDLRARAVAWLRFATSAATSATPATTASTVPIIIEVIARRFILRRGFPVEIIDFLALVGIETCFIALDFIRRFVDDDTIDGSLDEFARLAHFFEGWRSRLTGSGGAFGGLFLSLGAAFSAFCGLACFALGA